MPELPEVETIRRDLKEEIVGKTIVLTKIFDDKIIKMDRRKFVKHLKSAVFSDINRIGKLLIFEIAGGKNFLLIHLKMTGQLIYATPDRMIGGGHSLKTGKSTLLEKIGGRLPNKYSRFVIIFESSEALYFNDLRKFGYAKIVGEEELSDVKRLFGIEPLAHNFTPENLKKVVLGKKKSIKAILLDQRLISGLGNIYVDEVLFAARIDPRRRATTLSNKEICVLHKETLRIIKTAIKHRGTTFSDYSDAHGNKGNFSRFLQVYGRTGEKCNVCGAEIKKIREAGRGTHICSKCQK
jgi:formamidopyrimidine-DNA glycosylase